ncbi:MAG: hypothetical protein IT353_21225 [Gemmatimonadaceae bacterium]|nr:hypothetical protein [Gemmatimonadaceae bacterium]
MRLSFTIPVASASRRVAAICAALLLGACGGGGETAPGSITVSVSPSALTLQQGASGSVTVSVVRSNVSGTVTVSAEGAPNGVTASVTPATLTGSTTSATIAVNVAASTAPGSYPITVRATATGVGAQTTTYTLTVVPPPDFSIAASPTAVTVSSAATASSAVTITRTGGFAGAVAFAVTSAQVGITGVVTPNNTTGTAANVVFSATSAVPVGTYPVNIVGTGTGIGDRSTTVNVTVVAPPDFSLAATPTALTVTAGTSQTASIAITRSGGFADAVALTLQSATSGITGTFTPASVTGATASVSVAVASTVPAGSYTATINGNASAIGNRTVAIPITVLAVPSIAMTLSPTSNTLAAGTNTTTTVTLTRTNFTGPITMGTVGVPSGVTVSFAPSTVTGTTTVATISVAGSVPAGGYNLSISATGAGVSAIASTFGIVVTSASSDIDYRFCTNGFGTGEESSFSAPLWFAFQSGNGAWTRVLPTTAGGVTSFRFSLSNATGAVAFINEVTSAVRMPQSTRPSPLRRQEQAGSYSTTIRYGTREELAAIGAAGGCVNTTTKRHTGSFVGLGASQFGRVALGGGFGAASSTSPNFAIDVELAGPQTLFAQRTSSTNVTDKMMIWRGVNQANNTVLPPINFNADSAFAPLATTLTVLNSESDNVSATTNYIVSPGQLSALIINGNASTSTTRTINSVPLSLRLAGEVDEVVVTSTRSGFSAAVSNDYEQRTVATVPLTQGANLTVTMGPRLVTPTLTVVSGATAFPRARLIGTLPVEYGFANAIRVSENTSSNQFVIKFSSAYRAAIGAGNNYEFTFPDFGVVPGFIFASVVPRGVVTITTSSDGFTGTSPLSFTPGRIYRSVVRIQDASF